MHATEVSWLNLKIVYVFRAVRFLFSFALHSFLIKQEKRMNKEFSHWFPDKALFASCRVRARPGGPVRKFSRRTPTSDYYRFLCIPLLFVTNWFITSVKYPIFRLFFFRLFSCRANISWQIILLVEEGPVKVASALWAWLILRNNEICVHMFVMEHYFVNSSREYLFNISNITATGFNSFATDEICTGAKLYLFSLWSSLAMHVQSLSLFVSPQRCLKKIVCHGTFIIYLEVVYRVHCKL